MTTAARRTPPRPAAVTKPALALAAVSAALFGIARTTGSGWLIVLLALIGAVAVLAVVLPAPAAARLRVGVSTPRDAMVGVPLRVRVDVTGTRQPLLLRVGLGGDWTAASPPAEGWLSVTPDRRGVYDAVAVDVRMGAPLGLVWWKRSYTCPLERPLEIGPWPADVAIPAPAGAGSTGNETRSAPHRGDDLVRGARDYRPGDAIKNIHWTATARHGELMVKELEAAAAPPIAVSLDLRRGTDREVEAAAALAAGVCVEALEHGIPVTLLTAEAGGQCAEAVTTRVDVSRRLARATAGQPAPPPAGVLRVVMVDASGVRW